MQRHYSLRKQAKKAFTVTVPVKLSGGKNLTDAAATRCAADQYVASTRAGPPEPCCHGITPTVAVAPVGGILSRLRRHSMP